MIDLLIDICAYIIIVLSYLVAFYFIAKTILMAISMGPDTVPYVPAMNRWVRAAERSFEFVAGDKVVDIGSGDGKVVNRWARRHKKVEFTGVEIRKHLVIWSRMHKWFFINRNAEFLLEDALQHDFSKYNKVYMYLMKSFIVELLPKLESELASGTVVISAAFGFGDEFEKKHEEEIEIITTGNAKNDKIYVWRKP